MKLILTTLPSEPLAMEISSCLVSSKLVACVNIIKGVSSLYFWEGEIQNNTECILLIKTASNKVLEVEEFFKLKHPYEIFEFVVVEPDQVTGKYRDWVLDCVRSIPES